LNIAKKLLEHGPFIASGKIGLANFGILGGVEHYILVVGVKIKTNEIIIYDPLSVDFSKLRYSKPSTYNFHQFITRVRETLVLNHYSLNLFHIKYPTEVMTRLQ